MPYTLVGSNVVIVARQFNPSVFSQLWLVRNGIVSEGDFVVGSLYSDEVAKIETRRFGLLVIPPQLQFQPRVAVEEEAQLVAGTVGAIIRTLPHTPYAAAGMNFAWHVWSEDGDMHRLSQALFLRPDGPFSEVFGDCDDAMFGGYFSKDVLGCRLRLDVKPVDFPSGAGLVQQRLQLAFNFQVGPFGGDAVPVIDEHLHRWEQLKEESLRIVTQIEPSRGYQ
jgi:hypothetical protein